MLTSLIAQAAESDFTTVVQSVDSETLGIALILTVIGVFVTVIAVSITFIESRKKLQLARLQREMIDDLVNRGFKPDEIEKLVHGQTGWDKFCGIFQQRKSEFSDSFVRPASPVKKPV